MFTHITIDQFMLVEHLELELARGMTAITGETGTGKSLLLDALSLALGAKAHGDCVRTGASKATISATFIPTHSATQWLTEHDLLDGNECIIRRIISKEGRSRCYINGQIVSLSNVRTLGDLLVDIHSQHAHQSLLKKDHQRNLLDDYADHAALLNKTADFYQQWQTQAKMLAEREQRSDELSARHQLLMYQVSELDQLALTTDKLTSLENEQSQLANAESILTQGSQLQTLCDDESQGLRTQLHKARQLIHSLQQHTAQLNNAEHMLEQAIIHIDEAEQDIGLFLNTIELDPNKLATIEHTLSTIYDTARKHRVEPEALPNLHQQLACELATLSNNDQSLEALAQNVELLKKQYFSHANKLSNKRIKTAKQLSYKVNQLLQELSMKDAQFVIAIDSDETTPSRHGIDAIELRISTNKGHMPKSLHKVASGGELSRISLAIEVVTAQSSRIPTLIFDEVDVGIGGSTALVVGKLLSTLGHQCQVFCVTHLAQVASFSDQHWQVQKISQKNHNTSTITPLNGSDQVQEIARMISGDQLSKQSLAHAEQMLQAGLH